MVQANEIRVGNIINFDGQPDTVCEICTDNLTKTKSLIGGKQHYRYYESRLDPIELTPEILEKAGFEKHRLARMDYYELKINEKEKLGWEPGGSVEYGIMGVSQYEWSEMKIAYLHELQNLYWCLVGKELEINLQ